MSFIQSIPFGIWSTTTKNIKLFECVIHSESISNEFFYNKYQYIWEINAKLVISMYINIIIHFKVHIYMRIEFQIKTLVYLKAF